MRRALPAIAVSAAGVAWLLHAQGHLDDTAAAGGTTPGSGAASAAPAPGGRVPTTTTPTSRVPGQRTVPTSPTTTTPSGSGTGSGGGSSSGSGSSGGGVTGSVVTTRFGDVQVSVTISGNQITDVQALEYPSRDRRSQAINSRALPTLQQEVLAAQSADIDVVSGATITSGAYEQSLQAALDTAGFHH